MAEIRAETKLEIVPAATHLFEEAGALDNVAHLACDWFRQHLAIGPETGAPSAKKRLPAD